MPDIKSLLSIVAVVLTFAAYVPYFRDIFKGKTKPHLYSWILWGVLSLLVAGLQAVGGAGAAIWPTVVVGFLCLAVAALSVKGSSKYITATDTAMAILSLLAIVFWLVIDQPVISLFLVIAGDILAFIPTVRKSWHDPYSETLSMYAITTLRYILVVLAIQEYTLLSALWPAFWVVGNAVFVVILALRRKQVPARKVALKSR